MDTANSPALSSITEVSSSNMWPKPVSIKLSANHSSGFNVYFIPPLRGVTVFGFGRMVVFWLGKMDHGSFILTGG